MIRWQCRRQQAALVDYVDGTLDGAAVVRLERHLATCPSCADVAAGLRDVPGQLLETPLPDPGEEFWLQQRHAIARAVRNLPSPRRDLWAWIEGALERPRLPWRVPLATAASLVLALSIYRFAAPPRHVPNLAGAPSLASLDDDSLVELHDLVSVVAPHDEPLGGGLQDEELLTSLPLSDLIGSGEGSAGSVTADTDDDTLDGSDGAGDDVS